MIAPKEKSPALLTGLCKTARNAGTRNSASRDYLLPWRSIFNCVRLTQNPRAGPQNTKTARRYIRARAASWRQVVEPSLAQRIGEAIRGSKTRLMSWAIGSSAQIRARLYSPTVITRQPYDDARGTRYWPRRNAGARARLRRLPARQP